MICRFLIVKSLWIPYLVETFLWYDIYIFLYLLLFGIFFVKNSFKI